MPEPSRELRGSTPPTLTTASAGCGSSGSRTYSSEGVASSHAPITATSSTPAMESPAAREYERVPIGPAPYRGPWHDRAAMAVTRGMRYLEQHGVPFGEHRYAHRVKGAAYAAEAL